MKASKRILGIYISGVVLAVTLQYYLFSQFLGYISEEIVNAWYYGEIINLQEGQILPAITKNQNLLQKSQFIKAVVLVDKNEPEKLLFSVGELSRKITHQDFFQFVDKIKSQSVGFLKSHVVIPISKNKSLFMVYEFGSDVLNWTFFFTLAIVIIAIMYLIIFTQKILLEFHGKKLLISSEIRQRLTHDLRSPLLSLASLEKEVSKLNNKKVINSFKLSIDRIRQLIDETDKDSESKISGNFKLAISDKRQKSNLVEVVKELITENEYIFKSTKNVNLVFKDMLISKNKIYAEISPLDMKRHLSNLLHNSFEAIEHNQGEICITLKNKDDKVEIEIQDNGKGIPANLIESLGVKGFTYGKPNGHGLGLYYIKKTISEIKGDFSIKSEVGFGTKINIVLPTCASDESGVGSSEFDLVKINNSGISVLSKKLLFDAYERKQIITEVSFKENSLLVFVDDDQIVLNLWKDYIQKNRVLNESIFFSNFTDFEVWFSNSSILYDDIQFVFDYQISPITTGFDLIRKYGLEKEAIIVTNMI